jgi:hypothetical protein
MRNRNIGRSEEIKRNNFQEKIGTQLHNFGSTFDAGPSCLVMSIQTKEKDFGLSRGPLDKSVRSVGALN